MIAAQVIRRTLRYGSYWETTSLFSSRRGHSGHCSRSTASALIPWFVDQEEPVSAGGRVDVLSERKTAGTLAPVPQDAPPLLKELHAQLSQSPHLEPSTLVIRRATAPPAGPALPLRRARGRRKRGGTYEGETMYDVPGSVWSWIVIAQVKEGTEKRGGIESVVRLAKRTGLLPTTRKRQRVADDGWALLDGGAIAVHVVSKDARERFFGYFYGH